MEKGWIVYILTNPKHNRTYLGATNNPKNRLRKHNGELKGGAKYTTIWRKDGKWTYHLQVTNLTKSRALSLERKSKLASVKKGWNNKKNESPVQRRTKIVQNLVKNEFKEANVLLLLIE